MDLQVLRIEFPVKTLRFLNSLLYFAMIRQDIASVNIDRQLPLPVQIAQMRVDPLMDIIMLRETGVKDAVHTRFYRIINPPRDRCFDLLVGQMFP